MVLGARGGTDGLPHAYINTPTTAPPGEKVPFSIQALWYDQKTRKAEHKDPKAYSVISALNVQVRTHTLTTTALPPSTRWV